MKNTGEISASRLQEKLEWVHNNAPTRHSVDAEIASLQKRAKMKPTFILKANTARETSARLVMTDGPLGLTPFGKHLKTDVQGKPASGKFPLTSSIQESDVVLMAKMFQIGTQFYLHDHGVVNEYSSVREEHYPCVDFWRNAVKSGPETTPGTYKRRLETLKTYSDRKIFAPDMDVFMQAVIHVSKLLAVRVRSEDLSLTYKAFVPFGKRKAGVGAPFYMNAATVFEGINMDDRSFELANTVKPEEFFSIPATLGGRNQRGGFEADWDKLQAIKADSSLDSIINVLNSALLNLKPSKARVVYGYSRAENYVLSKVMVPLTNALQAQQGMFISFGDPQSLTRWLKDHYEISKENGLVNANIDFPKFDTSLSAEILIAAGLALEPCITDAEGRNILWCAIGAAICKPITYLDQKGNFRMMGKFGSMPSGAGLTNLVDGVCNAIIITYAKFMTYGIDFVKTTDYKYLNKCKSPFAVAGDDHMGWLKKLTDLSLFTKHTMKAFGIEFHHEKGEAGTFFTQFRYSPTWSDGLLSPIPRGITKIFNVESPKHLYNNEWNLATWAKLDRSENNPEYKMGYELVFPYSDDKLGAYNYKSLPSQVLNTVQTFSTNLRDELALHDKFDTEEDLISDGDPLKKYMFNASGAVENKFIKSHLDLVQSLVDSKNVPPTK